MSGSQDQKNCQYCDYICFGEKITTGQIRFCNERWPGRTDEGINTVHYKMT